MLGTAAVFAVSSCAAEGARSGTAVPVPGGDGAAAHVDTTDTTDVAATTAGTSPIQAGAPDTTEAPTPSTSTTSTTSTTTVTSTTTSTVPPIDAFDPTCVVEVAAGESLGLIADRYDDETINAATVAAENSIDADLLSPGQLLDICVDNGLDDITGSERQRNPVIVAEETAAAVRAQQTKLNELFAGYGIRELLVDGISGPVTRQRLCAARLGLGLEVTLTDMEPGSDEEAALFAAESIAAPFTTALNSDRWILIDRTCQIMFVGEGPTQLNFVFPTSTGSEGHETRDQDRSAVYRYDPALHNDGWHNSTTFPVAVDNPLNGNMYRPLYFDGGQAIHGANNVPTTPQSKGCARLRPGDQDALVNWLGLADANGPRGSVGVTVNVQGEYQGETL